MSAEKVWLRFERKKRDGTVWKLRIQDVPPARLDEVINLQANYFPRDEVVQKAIGTSQNPEAVKEYKEFMSMIMHDPLCHNTICCEDNGEKVGDIMGISSVTVGQEFDWDKLSEKLEENGTTENKKAKEVFHAIMEMYSARKAFNLSLFIDDVSVLVMPKYRGYGIAQQLLRTRRIMCAELNIPMTGAWMTAHGTQIAATKDGWKTVFEINYDELARTHNLVFEDAPLMMKYMVAGPPEE